MIILAEDDRALILTIPKQKGWKHLKVWLLNLMLRPFITLREGE
jgi:hypothetical protein